LNDISNAVSYLRRNEPFTSDNSLSDYFVRVVEEKNRLFDSALSDPRFDWIYYSNNSSNRSNNYLGTDFLGEHNIRWYGENLSRRNNSINWAVLSSSPFINVYQPLGDDGLPFTADDGLRLDPYSEYAEILIDVPTPTSVTYEEYDILGKNRIIGTGIDIGAYEYSADVDTDGDGIGDENDEFPFDPSEYTDSDSDGIGDNTDNDDDNDGVSDYIEAGIGSDSKVFDSALYDLTQSLSSGPGEGFYSLEEIVDLRPGSTMIEIHNGQATLTMEVEESDDLGVWTNESATSIEIPIDAEAGKKFFRFKMAE
jgi:hypothetical protein